MCNAFLDLRDLLVWLLDERQHLESVYWQSNPVFQSVYWYFQGELTLRFRDEYDLAEPEEVRGAVLDDAVVFMLGFDELVG